MPPFTQAVLLPHLYVICGGVRKARRSIFAGGRRSSCASAAATTRTGCWQRDVPTLLLPVLRLQQPLPAFWHCCENVIVAWSVVDGAQAAQETDPFASVT